MIKLQKVDKFFGDFQALKKISFQAREGEIIGFLGPNGAGKTTTMRILAGYLKADSGEVELNGYDPITQRLQVLGRVGYLPENNPLYQEMRVAEYLDFIKNVKGGLDKQLSEVVSKVAIEEIMEKKIEELSRGFKQRVGLAAALLGDPKILILDEPTSGLDPLEQEKIRDLIKKLRVKRIVILSTHILSEVEDISTRLIIIDKGKIVYDGGKPKGKGSVEKMFKKLVK